MESKLDILEGQINEKTYLLVTDTDTELESTQRNRVHTGFAVVLSLLLSAFVLLSVTGTTQSISNKLFDVSLNAIISPSIDTYTNVDMSGMVIDSDHKRMDNQQIHGECSCRINRLYSWIYDQLYHIDPVNL